MQTQPSPVRFSWFAVPVLALLVLVAGFVSRAGDDGATPRSTRLRFAPLKSGGPVDSGAVHGTLVTELGGRKILVPGVAVHLWDITTGVPGTSVTTDLDGRFQLERQPAGAYLVCWSAAGWVDDCGTDPITLGSDVVYPPMFTIEPELISGPNGLVQGVIRGHVSLADGSMARYEDPFFGVSQMASVVVADGLGVPLTGSVTPNRGGDYVVAGVPAGQVQVRATYAGQTVVEPIVADDDHLSGAEDVPLTFSNQRPRVKSLAAYRGSDRVRNAALGEFLDLVAGGEDADGDPLTWSWKADPGGGTVVPGELPGTASWKAPQRVGRQTLHVLVSDGKGGYGTARTGVFVDDGQTVFSGRVVDPAEQGLAGVKVEMSGVTTTTGQSGLFTLRVPPQPRYVLNLILGGYVPGSFVFLEGTTGGIWTLQPTAPPQVFNPSGDILVQTPEGAEVFIPGGALVDPSGVPASVPLRVFATFLDPSRAPLPGDNTAVDLQGQTVALDSFGALGIYINDDSGKTYNLASGATASLTIPVYPSRLVNLATGSTLPAQINTWWYNPATGIWEELGMAPKLGQRYTFQVSHFSTFNLDFKVPDPACFQIEVDEDSLKLPMRLRLIHEPTARRFERTLDDRFNMAYNVDPSAPFTFEPLDARGNVIGPAVQVGVDSGPGVSPFPPYPYDGCRHVLLKLDLPLWSGHPDSVFLTFKGPSSDAQATDYYDAIDPSFLRRTLGDFWAVNGWDAAGEAPDEVRGSYVNWIDLGFGRDMHCRDLSPGVACYVTNYTTHPGSLPNQDPANADCAAARDVTCVYGTVAMEYSPVEGEEPHGPIVKFYVYGGGDALAPLINSATLDEFGPKFVPNLCLNCHGGNYFPAGPPGIDDVDMGSSFLPFDLDGFTYTSGRLRADLTPAEETDYKELNDLVNLTSPNAAITELIDGWYVDPTFQDNSFIPDSGVPATSWTFSSDRQGLYRDVVAAVCRNCHIAQRGFGIEWNTYGQFQARRGSIDFRVCADGFKAMPHAFFTYEAFWFLNHPNLPAVYRPGVLKDFEELPGWAALGVCD